ncbi:hypothetical protein Pfl01_2930 [Pseudomonas fluorescens Pf0-1]|uniref:Uncharacterized protein n=1 Tax=Pseudomonas fluorescens (strain Pf0-1) TaxID=205922 RepID=Q3KC34_PSEPF|nr:hypothetical protein Pfl01_2930 [Pseudomonas fluorescens Pf0-1]
MKGLCVRVSAQSNQAACTLQCPALANRCQHREIIWRIVQSAHRGCAISVAQRSRNSSSTCARSPIYRYHGTFEPANEAVRCPQQKSSMGTPSPRRKMVSGISLPPTAKMYPARCPLKQWRLKWPRCLITRLPHRSVAARIKTDRRLQIPALPSRRAFFGLRTKKWPIAITFSCQRCHSV